MKLSLVIRRSAISIPNGPSSFVYTLSGLLMLTVMDPELLSSGESIEISPSASSELNFFEFLFTRDINSEKVRSSIFALLFCEAVHE